MSLLNERFLKDMSKVAVLDTESLEKAVVFTVKYCKKIQEMLTNYAN